MRAITSQPPSLGSSPCEGEDEPLLSQEGACYSPLSRTEEPQQGSFASMFTAKRVLLFLILFLVLAIIIYWIIRVCEKFRIWTR